MGVKVGIIGAGITGLALGASLQRSGFDVHIYEKASSVRTGGSGITLAPNALTALDALGLGTTFRARQQTQAGLRGGVRDPSGRWLSRIPAFSLGIDRAELHELLLATIDPARIHTGFAAVSIDAQAGSVLFSAHPTHHFDLIVGADGINSVVRRSCFDDPGIRFAGYNAWRAITDHSDSSGTVSAGSPFDTAGPLDPDVSFETWGARQRFGVVPLHCGRTYWFAVATGPEAQPGDQQLDQLEAMFSHWHDPIPSLLRATDPNAIQLLPIKELVAPLNSYHTGKVVLIGDAAHAMTPNLGQGACQGLEDAAVLARILQRDRLDLALYDEHRLRRTQHIARQSRLIGQTVHTGGTTVAMARNWLLRHMPDSATARRTYAVTDWRMPAGL